MNWLKEKVGLKWLVFLCVVSGCISYNFGWGGLLAFPLIVCYGAICVMLVEWIKPDAIMTTGGFFSLLWAKMFWNFGAHITTMLVGIYLLAGLLTPDPLSSAQSDVSKFCAEDKIAQTGIRECENAKKRLSVELKKILPQLKENYKLSNNSVKKLEKDKELKCSEKGLKDFGSQGCENAKQSLEAEKTKANDLDKSIKELEKELSDITKK